MKNTYTRTLLLIVALLFGCGKNEGDHSYKIYSNESLFISNEITAFDSIENDELKIFLQFPATITIGQANCLLFIKNIVKWMDILDKFENGINHYFIGQGDPSYYFINHINNDDKYDQINIILDINRSLHFSHERSQVKFYNSYYVDESGLVLIAGSPIDNTELINIINYKYIASKNDKITS